VEGGSCYFMICKLLSSGICFYMGCKLLQNGSCFHIMTCYWVFFSINLVYSLLYCFKIAILIFLYKISSPCSKNLCVLLKHGGFVRQNCSYFPISMFQYTEIQKYPCIKHRNFWISVFQYMEIQKYPCIETQIFFLKGQ